jgi:hypothetical protein
MMVGYAVHNLQAFFPFPAICVCWWFFFSIFNIFVEINIVNFMMNTFSIWTSKGVQRLTSFSFLLELIDFHTKLGTLTPDPSNILWRFLIALFFCRIHSESIIAATIYFFQCFFFIFFMHHVSEVDEKWFFPSCLFVCESAVTCQMHLIE